MQSCDIIIPVWNQLEATRDCVNSIIKHTGYPYRIIFIDNASDKATGDYLNELKNKAHFNVILIRNDRNLGFAKAVNQGLEVSNAGYVCIMNNDTIATTSWLGEMIDLMKADSAMGMVNPSSNTSGQFPAKSQSIDEYALGLKRFKGETQELYTCRGFCMLLTREVLEVLGPFDETYDIGFFEETDYSMRAGEKGFKIARAKASYVYHKEGLSFKERKDSNSIFENNERIFLKRWGKPSRVGFFFDRMESPGRIDDMAITAARRGHQVLIFLKRGVGWPVTIDHFGIRRFDVNPLFFYFVSIYKILKRKSKKKLDVILTDNPFFGSFLMYIKFLHGSDVMIRPDKNSLLELLSTKSRNF